MLVHYLVHLVLKLDNELDCQRYTPIARVIRPLFCLHPCCISHHTYMHKVSATDSG